MKLRFSYVDGGYHPKHGQMFLRARDVFGDDPKEVRRYEVYIAGPLPSFAPYQRDCDRILDAIKRMEEGVETTLEIEGEDTDLTLTREGGQIDDSFDVTKMGNPDGMFTLREFKNALLGWKEFLGKPESFDSIVEVEL